MASIGAGFGIGGSYPARGRVTGPTAPAVILHTLAPRGSTWRGCPPRSHQKLVLLRRGRRAPPNAAAPPGATGWGRRRRRLPDVDDPPHRRRRPHAPGADPAALRRQILPRLGGRHGAEELQQRRLDDRPRVVGPRQPVLLAARHRLERPAGPDVADL